MILTALVAGVCFVAGLALIPLVAMTFKDALPGALAEPFANLLATIGFFVAGDSTLHQTETGEYEVRPIDGSESGPKSYMSRFKMVDFGISFDVTREAFGSLAADVNPDNFVDEDKFPIKAATSDLARGGVDWYVDLREDGLRVPIGESLSQLKGRQSLEMVTQTISEAHKKHGGDTSSLSPTMHLVGFSLFTFMGLLTGVVIFL